MSTQTLSEWARGATPEQKCELLWTLANLAEQSMPVGCDPSEIAVEDADPSRVHVTSSGSETNLAWWPPEAVSPTSDAGTNLELSRSLYGQGLPAGARHQLFRPGVVFAGPKLTHRL